MNMTPKQLAAVDQAMAATEELINGIVGLTDADDCGHTTRTERVVCLSENLINQISPEQLALAVALMAIRLEDR